jgi:hypothetical protein
MSDLLTVEYRFRELQEAIRHPVSTACKLRLVGRFLSALPPSAADAYREEILQVVGQVVQGPPPIGAGPEDILEIADRLDGMEEEAASSVTQLVQERLRLFAAFSFALVGEPGQAELMLSEGVSRVQQIASDTPSAVATLPRERFLSVLEGHGSQDGKVRVREAFSC